MNTDNLITYGMNILKRVWRTGNKIGRLAILSILGWFAALVSFAAFQMQILSTAMVFIPILSAVLLFSAYPVISGAVIAEPHTRKAAQFFAGLVGSQMLIGIYFMLVPVSNAPNLVPILVAAGIAYMLFKISSIKSLLINSFLVLLMIVITIVFLMGGIIESKKSFMKALGIQTVEERISPEQMFTLRVDYSQGFKESALSGNYDIVKPKIKYIDKLPEKIKSGEKAIVLSLITAEDLLGEKQSIKPEDLKKEVRKSGFRLATTKELLQFGAKFPKQQKKTYIITLDKFSAGLTTKKDVVAYLSCKNGSRKFALTELWEDFNPMFKFAVITKETATKQIVKNTIWGIPASNPFFETEYYKKGFYKIDLGFLIVGAIIIICLFIEPIFASRSPVYKIQEQVNKELKEKNKT